MPTATARTGARNSELRLFSHRSNATTQAPMPAPIAIMPRATRREHALGDRGHQRRLGREQRIGVLRGRHADAVGLRQQVEHGAITSALEAAPIAKHHLLLPGRGAHDIAALEVLQVVAAMQAAQQTTAPIMIAATGPSGAFLPISRISTSDANRIVQIVMPETGCSRSRRGPPCRPRPETNRNPRRS